MQMNLNKDFSSLTLGSAHEKFDVWNGPNITCHDVIAGCISSKKSASMCKLIEVK